MHTVFHIWTSPIVQSNERSSACAYTQLALRYARWLAAWSSSHHVRFYSTDPDVVIPHVETVPVFQTDVFSERKVAQYMNAGWWLTWYEYDPATRIVLPQDYRNGVMSRIRYDLSNAYTRDATTLLVDHVKTCPTTAVRHILVDVYSQTNHVHPDDVKLIQQVATIVIPCDMGGWPSSSGIPIHCSQSFQKYQTSRRKEKNGADPPATHYVCPPAFDDVPPVNCFRSKVTYLPYLYLARLQACKGLDIVLEVARQHPDYEFWIAGEPVRMDDETVTYDATTLRKADLPNVRWLGFVPQHKRHGIMQQCEALIQPSLYDEPFGWNVIEAYGAGIPVITSCHGAFAETVIHGVTGFAVEPTPGAVGACLAEVLFLDSQRCFQEYQRYHWKSVIPRWLDMVEEICSKYGPTVPVPPMVSPSLAPPSVPTILPPPKPRPVDFHRLRSSRRQQRH